MECWICGKEATKTLAVKWEFGMWDYRKLSQRVRCYCDECAEKVKAQEKADEAERVRLKKKQMFNRALDILESQNTMMYKLRPAIDKVEEYLKANPDKFDSSYEVLTSIVLINAGIKFQMQKKILRYQVDFFIPSHKVILEIDGDRHKNRKKYDHERDEQILDVIGLEWNIVRIPTENLDKNAMRLIKAIDAILKRRAREISNLPIT